MVLLVEKQFEDPAQRYAVPSTGVIWGSSSKEIQEDYVLNQDVFEGKYREMRGQGKEW
jgi:hypothetical protein